MNYPVWDVPVIGGAWVIGIIAIFHVLISQFAVGGGLYLVLAERKADRDKKEAWFEVLKKHSKFFLLLTGVFGTVSGVGIWFAIGLVHPEATSTLIHNFVFGWAIEWAFFMIELTAAAVYYYTWDRVDRKTHIAVGWVYAIASVLTLVIINGILTFMLTPGTTWLGVAGSGHESGYFWNAFFNPTYFPSLVLRTLVCISLAAVWALVSFSRLKADEVDENGRIEMIRWSTTWLIPAFVLMPFAFVWYLTQVPAENRHLLDLGMKTIGSGAFTQVTRLSLVSMLTSASIAAVAYTFAYRYPRDFSSGHAFAIILLAVGATASTEYAREAVRKPYVIGSHMYSNGIRVRDVEALNRDGYMARSMWGAGNDLGASMFRGQCMSCHTTDGYRSMKKLLADRNSAAITNILKTLHEHKPDSPYRYYMPPLVGSDAEILALHDYLVGLNGRAGVALNR